jgi:flagellum-specific peptidoglycan hydrolase FlgJ
MRKENHQSFIAYFTTVIVAFTVGLYFGAFSNPFVLAAPKTETPPSETKQWAQSEPLLSMPLRDTVQLLLSTPKAPVQEKATLVAAKPKQAPDPEAIAKQEIKSTPAVLTYETTAEYLNVRVSSNNKSDIINVVEKGTVLEVSSVTENGWLKLKGGGFVHGGYAKPIKTEGMKAEPSQKAVKEVKTLSVETKVNEPTSKVESISGLTSQHIATILKGTDLEDQGLEKAILQIEDEYGINAFFTIAVMKLESGNGSSRLARKKNNLFGLNATSGDAYNKGLSFKSKADCVLKFGELIANKYIEKGYTTIEKVAKKYCPANSKWPRHVKAIMERDQDLL